MRKVYKAYDCYVLTGKGILHGTVFHVKQPTDVPPPNAVVVVPHAGIDFDLATQHAAAVVTEIGHRLCHLVVVGREAGRKIVRLPDASKKLPPGSCITIDCEQSEVIVETYA
jgi:phosphohistidine swiveling domain-containing protein